MRLVGFRRALRYLNSRLLGYVLVGYIEPNSHYLGNWSPRVFYWFQALGLGFRPCVRARTGLSIEDTVSQSDVELQNGPRKMNFFQKGLDELWL